MDPAERDRYVAAFRGLVQLARSVPGCRDVAVTADSVDAGRVNIFELWESQEALEAWRAKAPAPDLGIAFDAKVLEYEVTRSQEPFS
jgi:quinol monooxygenase YgiN